MKRRTPDHPKVADLEERLHIQRFAAVGLLELLWHYVAEFSPQGNVGKYSNDAIARACFWTKGSDKFIEALIDSGWIDKDEEYRLLVHDWDDHMDETTRKRLIRAKKEPIIRQKSSRIVKPSVYFIQAATSKAIKIGFTESSVLSRLDSLQTASPEKLNVLAFCPGSRTDEFALHRRFSKYSLTGEWFQDCEELQLLISHVSTHGTMGTSRTDAERTPTDANGGLARGVAGKGSGRGKEPEVSKGFSGFWIRWGELTERRQRESSACAAWVSVVGVDDTPLVMACLERYGKSAEVARGVITNPDTWIYDQHRDKWQGDWPPPRPTSPGGGSRQSRIRNTFNETLREVEAQEAQHDETDGSGSGKITWKIVAHIAIPRGKGRPESAGSHTDTGSAGDGIGGARGRRVA